MQGYWENQRGISLVEMLAALVLISIISLMIYSIHLFGQKQFIAQNEQINNQENVQFAIKYIQKQIRKSGGFSCTINGKELKVKNDIYHSEDSVIYLNEKVLIGGISEFVPLCNSDGTLDLTIISEKDSKGKRVEIQTEIFSR